MSSFIDICARCGRAMQPGDEARLTMAARNTETLFFTRGEVPAGFEDQGEFVFDPRCAARELYASESALVST